MISDSSTGDEAFIDVWHAHPLQNLQDRGQAHEGAPCHIRQEHSQAPLCGCGENGKAKTSTYALLHSVARRQANDSMRTSEAELFGVAPCMESLALDDQAARMAYPPKKTAAIIHGQIPL